MDLMTKVDRTLGRLCLRFCAIVAFSVAAGATVFAAVVLLNGHIVGAVILAGAALFFWLGRVVWRDPATLGEVLNRDFERPGKSGKDSRVRDVL
ncbi:MAG: hypothetical protein R3F07_08485 [Opitutaceae bacterium]